MQFSFMYGFDFYSKSRGSKRGVEWFHNNFDTLIKMWCNYSTCVFTSNDFILQRVTKYYYKAEQKEESALLYTCNNFMCSGI